MLTAKPRAQMAERSLPAPARQAAGLGGVVGLIVVVLLLLWLFGGLRPGSV